MGWLSERPQALRFSAKPTVEYDGEDLGEWIKACIREQRDHYLELSVAVMVWGGGIVYDEMLDVLYQDYTLPFGTIRKISKFGVVTDDTLKEVIE